jgi:hypothetical protein
MAVNYTQVRPDLNPRLILTATLLSVLLFEVVAGREGAALVESLEADAVGVRTASSSGGTAAGVT